MHESKRRQENVLQGLCRQRNLTVWVLLLLVSGLSGCSRAYYRKQADREAYQAIDQAAKRGNTGAAVMPIQIDPKSRMFDPDNPDCPPMPLDDPESHEYMLCVDCKKGAPCYRHAAKTPYAQNPNWLAYLPRNENGAFVLDMEGAVQTAMLHSPEFQENLEELYLSALDVTFERFRFDTQFFGGSSVFFTADGPDRAGGPSSILNVSPFDPSNRLRAQRLTATGGEIVVGIANSLVWQFAGPDDYRGNTLLDFNIVQPLLRQAGRVRVLERLTIAERALLANIRQMERFRRGFYAEVAVGRNAGAGPNRRGGFFGGAGLSGFSGVGGGGFGGVGGGFFGGGGGGGGVAGGAGAAGAGGFMGLLQDYQEIKNQRANVVALRDSVAQLEASYDAGRIDRFQVELARQALYNGQSQLLTAEAAYESRMEGYKISLGLPPDLPLDIDDPTLDEFNLISSDISDLSNHVGDLLNATRELGIQQDNANEAQPPGEEEATTEGPDLLVEALEDPQTPSEQEQDIAIQATTEEERNDALAGMIEELPEIGALATQYLESAQEDYRKLLEVLPERREALIRLQERPELATGRVETKPFSVEQLNQRVEQLATDLSGLVGRLGETTRRLNQLAEAPPEDFESRRRETVNVLTKLSGELLELTLTQARARLDAFRLNPIDLSPEEALAIASQYRRDWKNTRASLVDTWRLIHFNANDLRSGLDLTFSGDVSNLNDNPFDIRDSTGRLRVGMRFDAPLTRLGERNVYRQALIEYQQARRNYYQYVDGVSFSLRNTLRTIRLNEINFELRREAVLIAAAQVDLAQLRLAQPPQPGETGQFGETTARDLVQALSDLLAVQNDFLSVWVNYQVQRIELDFDLGTMQVDPNGIWIDHEIPYRSFLPPNFCPPKITAESGTETLPPGLVQPGENLPEVDQGTGELPPPPPANSADWESPGFGKQPGTVDNATNTEQAAALSVNPATYIDLSRPPQINRYGEADFIASSYPPSGSKR